MDEGWEEAAARQHGVLALRDLEKLGVTRAFLRNQLRAERWVKRSRTVVSTTTGPPSWEQLLWLAVLHAGPGSLIGGLTAAKVHGLTGWDRPHVTVLVEDDQAFEALDGVEFVRTRRLQPEWVSHHALPTCRVEPAALLFAGYEPNLRTACGLLAAVVQQRLTEPQKLQAQLVRMKPLRRAAEFRTLLTDLAGGAQSLAEVDIRRACRRRGVQPPSSQRKRRDRSGRQRYTDCEWLLLDGRTLVLEVDGAFHDNVLQAMDDKSRNRKLAATNRIVTTCSAYELRYDADSVIDDLIALGVPLVS